jgi:hypothetical protein
MFSVFQQLIIGIMQYMRDISFQGKDENQVNMLSQKFSKVAHLVLPDQNVKKVTQDVSLNFGEGRNHIDFLTKLIQQLFRNSKIDF